MQSTTTKDHSVPQGEMTKNDNPRNVIVFGQTGAGKSSLINMLARGEVAEVSSGVFGCTSSNENYTLSSPAVTADNASVMYTFWDTPGLNEGEHGNVPAQKAFEDLFDLVKRRSVNLVIYCIRGSRFTDIARVNYDLFWGIMCEGKAPIVLVVTGLEQERDMDAWWTTNRAVVEKMGMTFHGQACVTTTKGRNGSYDAEYQQSANKVWELVQKHCTKEPWAITPGWLEEIPNRQGRYMERYNARTGTERDVLPEHLRPTPLLVRLFQRLRAPRPLSHQHRRSQRRSFPPQESRPVSHNVILFGEAGSGKSSLVNMLIGQDAAKVAEGDSRCTFQNECYEAAIEDINFCFYDTPGLNEGDQHRLPDWKAIDGLYTLIRQLDGVSLLIYCMRGKIKENSRANWILFNKVICGDNVPILAVVTGLEHNEDLSDAKSLDEIREAFGVYKMAPKDIACVVSVRGKNNEYAEKYKWSQDRLRSLITQSRREQPWSAEKDQWFADIYQKVYTTGLCLRTGTGLEFVATMRNVIDRFVKETEMSEEDRDKLNATLLKAETKILENQEKNRSRKGRRRGNSVKSAGR